MATRESVSARLSTARQRRHILAAMHLLPALFVILARAPVVVAASASLAPIANGHERLVAALALGHCRHPTWLVKRFGASEAWASTCDEMRVGG